MFEHTYHDGREVASHADIDDDNQTVSYPSIHTTAVDEGTGLYEGNANIDEDGNVTIVDTVTYEGLAANIEYRMEGIVYDKETGKPLVNADGSTYTQSVLFTSSDTGNGTVDMKFEIPASVALDKTLVVFEYLYGTDIPDDETPDDETPDDETPDDKTKEKNPPVATHEDLDDEDQTVRYPKIHTTLTDDTTGTHTGEVSETVTITDTVEYEGLIPGSEHTMHGELYDKATGELLTDADGNTFEDDVPFIASETGSGSVDLHFEVPGELLSGHTVVAFEHLYFEGEEVASHANIDDADQSVSYGNPELHTSAKDAETQTHMGYSDGDTVVIDDIVSYEGLKGNHDYVLEGVLMDKDTDSALTDGDGKVIISEQPFTSSENGSGSVEVEFEIDSDVISGKSIVVFEYLYDANTPNETPDDETPNDETPVATHEDIHDEDQTVIYDQPAIHTSAEDVLDGDKTIASEGEVTVNDTVSYEGLTPGNSYILKGTLMDKDTGDLFRPVLLIRSEKIWQLPVICVTVRTVEPPDLIGLASAPSIFRYRIQESL